ncbi:MULTISPECIES: helix-turn-helix domain-containing protein [Streptomyces]|uniref:helix-turn-helix domain-containing protein n=1 Tax=Streptomyces TaxID=1883 RepID=UPI00338F17C3
MLLHPVRRTGLAHDPVLVPGRRGRRGAALAANGLTNREIAEELFITQRTVENHLTAGFRKLDIAGRRQLPAALQALDTHS